MFTYTKAKQIVEDIKLGYIEQIVDECELEINNIEGLTYCLSDARVWVESSRGNIKA